MAIKVYHPKGSMCMVCKKKYFDCNELPFNEMPSMKKYSPENDPTVFIIVKCTHFDKE